MSQLCPEKATATSTFGSEPSRSACASLAANASASRFQVRGSMSTKSTSAPQ
jgi:hypothetical protein